SGRFIVESMARDGVCEVSVGVTRDEQVGPMLMIGAGGILAELLKDAAVLLFPVLETDVARVLDRLAVGKLIAGYRGKSAGDRQALIEAVLAVARFVEAHIDRL
ncbi:MAG: acetate--CoA ligase family protein, partial [Alphaproteobacteria bacterium]|nr:acetate--CoA ligase family protein [Alphaproteobacteria bacterium]